MRDVETSIRNNANADRLGLLESQFMGRIPRPMDILVPTHGRTFKSHSFTCHLCTNELPLSGLRRLTDQVFVTSPELTFVQMGSLLTDVQLASIVGIDHLTPDLCWYDHKTLMEYDSWENHREDSRLAGDDLRI